MKYAMFSNMSSSLSSEVVVEEEEEEEEEMSLCTSTIVPGTMLILSSEARAQYFAR